MLFLTSVPNFVVSILVIVFCTKFVPGYSFIGSYSNFGEYLSRIFVPSIVMSLGVVAMLGRITRSSMIRMANGSINSITVLAKMKEIL